MTERKKVSIVIACRNEEKFIGRCLDSLLAQTYPKDRLEILVVNGASDDRTGDVVRSYARRYPPVKLLENPKKYTPISVNIGIKNATGDLIMNLGAHSELESSYVEKCVGYLNQYGADAVGGALVTRPATNTRMARAIVNVLTHFFGTGGSQFRTVKGGGVREVDTAFNPCFRKDVFERVGLYNERLIRSQDMEFNSRLRRAGGKILLAPDIAATYYPKTQLKPFFRHNVADGIWAVLPMKYGASPFKLRHLAPLFFVGGTAVGLALGIISPILALPTALTLALYLLVSLFFSSSIAMRERDALLVPFLMLAFGARHFGYGIGSLIGVIKLVSRN